MKLRTAVLALSLATAALGSAASAQSDAAADANPIAVINEARRDAEAGQLDNAIANYERALTLINGPSRAYDPIIRFNLATLYAVKGIDAFQADNLEAATASFRNSLQWNPYSRDIRYNLCQALYIRASRLREQETSAAEMKALDDEILVEAAKVRNADPANPNLLLILGYSHRNLGDESMAANAFAEKEGLPFEVHEVRMDVGTSTTKLSGVVKNLQRKPGDPIRLRFTMLALNGSAMATSDVEVAAPAIGEGATFGVSIATTQDVAGWRYDVR